MAVMSPEGAVQTQTYDWDALHRYRSARPFRPFFFEMKSGQVIQVLDAMWFGGVNDRLGVFDPELDDLQKLKVSDVVSVRLMTDAELAARKHLLRRKRA